MDGLFKNQADDLCAVANLEPQQGIEEEAEKEQIKKQTCKQNEIMWDGPTIAIESHQIAEHIHPLKLIKKSVPLRSVKRKNAELISEQSRNKRNVTLKSSPIKSTQSLEVVSKKVVSDFIDNYDEYKKVINFQLIW